MSACPRFDHLLVLPRLRIQNANAISSQLTHGFPSMTAFLGLSWALERKARKVGLDLKFKATGVVCHDHQEQVTEGGYVRSFRLTRNPIGKDGGTAAIVEEGRIHLELSLVFGVDSERWSQDPDARESDAAAVAQIIAGMRVAGGTVLPRFEPGQRRYRPWTLDLTGTDADQREIFHHARTRLLPGFSLVSHEARLRARLDELQAADPAASRLDAWLSLARFNWRYHTSESQAGQGEWRNDRKGQGWLVPIPVGYGALGDVHAAGSVANARDADVPFRFVESLYSIGEWISPHRLHSPQQLMWYVDSQPEAGLYRCRNDYSTAADTVAQLYDFD